MKKKHIPFTILAFLLFACRPTIQIPTATISVPTTIPSLSPTETAIPERANLKIIQAFDAHVLDALISPDKTQYLILLSDGSTSKMILYSFDTSDLPLATVQVDISLLQAFLPYTHALHFSPDGKTIFALTEEGYTIQFWDAKTLKPLDTWQLPEISVILAINPAGDKIISAGITTSPLYIFSYPEGALRQTLTLPPTRYDYQIPMTAMPFSTLTFSSDSEVMASTHDVLYKWNLAQEANSVLFENGDLDFQPAIFAFSEGVYLFSLQRGLYQFDLEENAPQRIDLPPSFRLNRVFAMSSSAQLASASSVGVFMLNLESGEGYFLSYPLEKTGENFSPSALFFSEDNQNLIGIFSQNIAIWSLP